MTEVSENISDCDSAHLLARYVHGSDDAARAIFDRYVSRLLQIAQTRLSPILQSRVDPEDIVQSAFRSFFRRVKEEVALNRNGNLWRVLATFTLNKTRSHIEKELAAKRTPRRENGATFWEQAIQREPSPEEAASLIEELKSFMSQLSPRNRRVTELRLSGASVKEIADDLSSPPADSGIHPQPVSLATVRRVLRESSRALEQRLLTE